MRRALHLLSLAVAALAEEGCFKKGVLYKDTALTNLFSNKGVVITPKPAGGYLADVSACQEACRLSAGCEQFSYDATLTPGKTGGACWFLYGNYSEVPNLLATSGPKVCPGSGSVKAAAMDMPAVPGTHLPSISPPLISAKEVFSNSAGEHAVGAIPGMVGQVAIEPVTSHHKNHLKSVDVATLTVLMLVAALCVIVNCYCCLNYTRKPRKERAPKIAMDDLEASSPSVQATSVRSAGQMAPAAFPMQSQQVYYTSQQPYYPAQPQQTWMVQPPVMTYQPVPQAVDQASVRLLQTSPQ